MFPLMIMLLVPVRQYLLPKFFKGAHLQDLDAAEYEEAPALPFNLATVTLPIFSLEIQLKIAYIHDEILSLIFCNSIQFFHLYGLECRYITTNHGADCTNM